MIGFLQPLALLGLVAAAIPPLLHLLARRVPPTVVFPAVRYLAATEREHSRRLKLRNLLLMILRTALIALLVLAAARPVIPTSGGSGHPPTALGVIVDNSLSSAAVTGGRRTFDVARQAAYEVIDRVAADDRLWLTVGDGVPRQMSPADARVLLDSLEPWPVRLDVATAVRSTARAVAGAPLHAAEIVVIGDQQASAFRAGETVRVPVLVWAPPEPPANRAIDSAVVTPREWTSEGHVIAAVGGDGVEAVAVRLVADNRDLAQGLAAPGDRLVLPTRAPRHGWLTLRLELDPDELRSDDRWWLAVRSVDPAAVTVGSGAGAFVREALVVLREGGRVSDGSAVHLDDRLHAGTTVLFPPSDPVLVGSVNRGLAARGSPWRFGDLVNGEWTVSGDVAAADGAAVFRRYRLVGEGPVLATVAGEPWLVRSDDVVIIASRMEEAWTDLPVRAGFVPFLDLVVNRLAARSSWTLRAQPGEVVRLPADVDAVLVGERRSVPPDRRITVPHEPGVYFLLAADDTAGAVEVNHDPRESALRPVTPDELRAALGPHARLLEGDALHRELFGAARRADLAGPLLVAALLVGLSELVLATAGGRVRDHP